MADITDVGRKIRLIDSQAKDLDRTLAQVNKALKLDPNNAELVAEKMRIISQESELLKQKLEHLKYVQQEMSAVNVNSLNPEQAEAYRASLGRVESEILKTQTQLSALGREAQSEADKARQKIEALKAELASTAETMNNKFNTGVGQLNTAFTQLVRIIAAVEAILLRLGVSVVKTGAEFDARMSQVAATLDIEQVVNQQEHAFARLRNEAIEYGRVTTYTASEAASALNELALGGLGVEKSMEALPRVLTLAKAGNMALDEAATVVVASMSALGLEVGEIDTLMDQMARTAQKSKVSVDEVGDTILKTASAFNLAGQDTSTMNAIIGTLGNRFKDITDQANTLRTALNRVSTYADELGKLGVEVEDNGQMRDFIDIFYDLRKALEGKTDTEQVGILTKIFGQRGYTYAAYLMQATTGELQALKYEIENADGAAQKMADTMTDNLQSDIVILKSAVESLSISITEKLTPSFRDATGKATAGINSITDEVDNGRLGKSFEDLGNSIGGLIEKGVSGFIEHGPTIIKYMTFIIDHADTLLKLIATFKISKWANTTVSGLVNIASSVEGLSGVVDEARANGVSMSEVFSKNSTAILNTATAALTASAAIGTLIASMIDAKAAKIDVANSLYEADEATQQLLKDTNELTDQLRENRQEKEADIQNIENQREEYHAMADRISELAAAEELDNSQKNEMLSLIYKLNSEIPNLNLEYDNSTKSLNLQNTEIEKLIDNYQDYQALMANMSYADELAEQNIKYKLRDEELTQAKDEAKKARDAAKQALVDAAPFDISFSSTEGDIDSKYNKFIDYVDFVTKDPRAAEDGYFLKISDADISSIKNLYTEYKKAQDNLTDYNDAWRDNHIAMRNVENKLEKVNEKIQKFNDNGTAASEAVAALSGELKKQHDIAIEYLETGDENSDALAKLLEQFPELIEVLEAEGYDLSNVIEKTEELTEEENDLVGAYEDAKKAISGYKSELKDLISILESVQKGTAYSTSQILDLIEKYPELTSAIHETADGYTIEAEAIENLMKVKAAHMVIQTQEAIAALDVQQREVFYQYTDMTERVAAFAELSAERIKLEKQLTMYQQIADSISNGRIYSGSSSGGTSSGGTSAADDYDPIKERKAAAQEEIAELERLYKLEEISAEEYYTRLMEIAERYYGGVSELRDEYMSAETKVYEGLKKAQEDELSAAKKLEDQLRAVKDAEDALLRAEKQQVQVYSGVAGFHAEQDSAAIAKAQQTLADKNYSLTETLLKNAKFDGKSLLERLNSIGLAQIKDLLPDLSGLRLPSVGGGSTTNNTTQTRTVTYNGGAINITIQGSVDEKTLPKLKESIKDAVRAEIDAYLDEENAERQTGGF